ncbi:MAG: hypothetical protein ACOYJD_01815 [Christensenellales bacterium]|jgi:hypothetical protein
MRAQPSYSRFFSRRKEAKDFAEMLRISKLMYIAVEFLLCDASASKLRARGFFKFAFQYWRDVCFVVWVNISHGRKRFLLGYVSILKRLFVARGFYWLVFQYLRGFLLRDVNKRILWLREVSIGLRFDT